jgi:hypothetical protein
MAVISAGTTTTTALVQTGDTTGNLVIKTGSSGTTALTVSGADQSVTFAGAVNVSSSAFALGSVSAPSITFTGDTNTGIYSPAADTIAFTEGGVESMRIDSSGNVGIGTSSPSSRLNVVSTVDLISDFNSSAASGGYMVWRTSGTVIADIGTAQNCFGTGGTDTFAINGRGARSLLFGTSNTERMRIDSSGNVGIGNTVATTLNNTSLAANLAVGTGATHAGVTVYTSTSTNGTIAFADGTSGSDTYVGYMQYQHGNNSLSFGTSAAERMRIDSSGNVLIGTTTGNYQLKTDSTFYNAAQLGILTTGRSGSEYPSVGYNVRYTATGNSYTYNTGDLASMIKFQSGQVQTFTAPDGTGGTAISFTAGPYVTNGGTSWTNSSDERLKDIIEPIGNAITKVSSLRAVIGKFKTDEEGIRRSFLIAQDVQAVLPEAVDSSDPDKLGVQYTDVIPLLVAAIKELNAKVTALEAQLENK